MISLYAQRTAQKEIELAKDNYEGYLSNKLCDFTQLNTINSNTSLVFC